MDSHPLYLNNRAVGHADTENGSLFAECDTNDCILRLYDGNENLGVMLPENGRMVLRKNGFKLKRGFNLIRSLPGEEPLFPLPFTLSHGEKVSDFSFVNDNLLRECLEKTPGIKCAFFGDCIYFYFPFNYAECEMAPFFFATTVIDSLFGAYAFFLLKKGEIKTIFSGPF